MRVLVVGGTRFVGRHITQALLDAGHEVTLFHRGSAPDDPFPQAEHRHGDRDGDLAELAEGTWDATVDVSAYVPRQVRALGEALGRAGGRGGHYAYISSISAYATPEEPGITESAALEVLLDEETEEVTSDTYGGLKALSEYAAVEAFGADTLIIRPTYVVGPYDTTGRFTAWVLRLAEGGEARRAGLDGRTLPLWHEGAHDFSGAVDPSAALRHGLRLRPVGDSARDVLAAKDVTPLVAGVGLDRGREAEVLHAWHELQDDDEPVQEGRAER